MVLSKVVREIKDTKSCGYLSLDEMSNLGPGSNPGIYTNNNYINVPEENHPVSLQPPTLSASITSAYPCMNAVPANRFTFATPTQTSLGCHVAQQYSCTSTPSTSVTNIVARTVPGLGATWQHSLPLTCMAHPRAQMDVTWQNCVPHMSYPQFGIESVAPPLAQLSVPQDMPWMQDAPPSSKEVSVFSAGPVLHPQLCYKRGPKRHFSLHNEDNGCSPSKQFISEEMMAARMQGLTIDSEIQPGPNLSRTVPVNPNATVTSDCQHTHTPRPTSWQRMKEIEERLEDEEDEEEVVSMLSSSSKQKPRLHVLTHNINAKDLLSTNQLLPKKIIDDLIKPTMQVVLWKPPGDLIKNTISQVVSNKEKPDLLSQTDGVCDIVPETESVCLNTTDNQTSMTDLPDLQQSETTSVMVDDNNSSVQTEEDMDL